MSAFLDKPLYGDPCNGCGLCCIAQQCPISEGLFGKQDICPAIERGDGKALVCGMVANPANYMTSVPDWGHQPLAAAFALLLGAGSGCDGTTEDDEPARIDEFRPIIRQRAQQAIEAAPADVRMLVDYLCQGSAPKAAA